MDAGIETGHDCDRQKPVHLVVEVFANSDSLTALFRSWPRRSHFHPIRAQSAELRENL